jgi:hypothetical protein
MRWSRRGVARSARSTPGAPLSGEQRALADAVAGLIAEVLRYRWTQAAPGLSGSDQQQPHDNAAH